MTSLLIPLLIIFAALPVYAGEYFYEAYTDGWSAAGISREGQGNALIHKVEQPYEYIGVENTSLKYGGEGVLPQNWEEYSENGACVYWLQSAVFPADDMHVLCADDPATAANNGLILPKGGSNIAMKAANYEIPEFKGAIKLTTKVRFDDYNAERYLFTTADRSTGSTVYNDFLWFDPNGKIYVLCLEDGIAVAKELMKWTAGEWYTVALTMNFDHSTVNVEVNGKKLITDAVAQSLTNWTALYPIRHKQYNSTTDERIFANSYVSGIKDERVSAYSVPATENKYYFVVDFTWNKAGIARANQHIAVQLATRQPWNYSGKTTATNVGADGQLPVGDEYRGNKGVYLVRTAVWPTNDTEEIPFADSTSSSPHLGIPMGGETSITDGSATKASYLLEDESVRKSNTLHWRMKVRFDDTNSTRNLFSMGHYDGSKYVYSDFLSFTKEKTFAVTYKNGETNIINNDCKWEVGEWNVVDLTMRLDTNVFSVYLNGEPAVTNVAAICDLSSWSRIQYIKQIHPDTSAWITEREFSNSYIDYIKAEYVEDKPLLWAKLGDVTNENGEISADVTFTNTDTLNESKNLTALLAVYEEDRLSDITYKNIDLNSPKTKKVSLKINGENGKNYTTKLLAFGDSLAPLWEDDDVVTAGIETYYTLDFEKNNKGYVRKGEKGAMYVDRTRPWTYSGETTTKKYGAEGMLPFEESFIRNDARIYWIKTGIWPVGDTEKVKTAGSFTSVGIPAKASPSIIMDNPSLLLENAEKREERTVVWEMSLRMDDYNSKRNLLSMTTDGSSYTDFITFDKDGILTVRYKENGVEDEVTKEYMSGEWQKVKLIIDYENNKFSFLLNDELLIASKEFITNLADITKIKLAEHCHLTNSSDITAREFSNTFIEYIKAYYEPNK